MHAMHVDAIALSSASCPIQIWILNFKNPGGP